MKRTVEFTILGGEGERMIEYIVLRNDEKILKSPYQGIERSN